MKINKLLIAFLAVSTLMVSCKKDDNEPGNSDNNSESKLKKIVTTSENRKATMNINYASNGFIDKLNLIKKKEENITFKYNSEKQIIETKDDEFGITTYEYKNNKVVKSVSKDEYDECDPNNKCNQFAEIITTSYEYNVNGTIKKETRQDSSHNLTNGENRISNESVTIYETDEKGRILKEYTEGTKENTITYTYLDVKDPLISGFPENFRSLALPQNKYLIASITNENGNSERHEYKITDGKIVKQTISIFFSGNTYTKISEYFY